VHTELSRKIARWSASAGTVGAVLVLASCSGGDGDAPPACTVNSVNVSASPQSIIAGTTTTLTATVNATGSCASSVTWSATPAGTLTPSGNSATFTAAAAAPYTIRATSTADGGRSGTATVTVLACGQANGVVINHGADVSTSETWAGDGITHTVPSSGLAVRGSATLTVAPCAVVSLAAGASITVRDTARLVAAGTSDTRFVTFRRADAAQGWGQLRGLSSDTLIDLAYTRLEGGGAVGGATTVNSVIRVSGSGVFGSLPAPVLRANNVTIQGSADMGVYLEGQAAFSADSQALTIAGAAGRPVNIDMMPLGSLPGGSYTCNGIDEVLVTGPSADVYADVTVEDRGLPIRIPAVGMNIAPLAGQPGPVTLTLKPGVVLRFPKTGGGPGARVKFGTNGNAPNNAVGVLNAVGTAARPITFTSGEANPAPGDWIGLWLNTANGSRLEHVNIEYAGAPSGINSGNCKPVGTSDDAALLVGSFSTQYVPPADLITHSRISSSAGYGINAMWQAPTVSAPNLTAGNLFQNNALCRQTFNAPSAGACPVGGGCTAN
jgi:hypothetical protein